MIKILNLFATCPKNLEGLLEDELKNLGAKYTKQTIAGVKFSGDLTLAYRACLWSRIANRILLPLGEFNADDAESLYRGAQSIDWLEHIKSNGSFIINFSGTSTSIKHSHFGALKVKDAIVDQIRNKTGIRPDIEKDNPDLRINVYLYNNVATISIDLSGESLHKRFYRTDAGEAPLKENLAAAILYRSKWLEFSAQGKPMLDPMCGSGTILIEAAMIALDCAPGLNRISFGFNKWLKHDNLVWQNLLQEARIRLAIGTKTLKSEIRGYDCDPKMITIAKRNIANAGFTNIIDVMFKEVYKFTPPTHHGNQYGIIVTNPPYGIRLNNDNILKFYQDFGKVLKERFINWKVAMLTSSPEFGKALSIHSHKQYSFFNGAIACKLILLDLIETNFYRNRT